MHDLVECTITFEDQNTHYTFVNTVINISQSLTFLFNKVK